MAQQLTHTIAFATAEELYKAQRFYDARGYGGDAIAATDRVLLARDGDEIVGVVRLSPLDDDWCLRGMQIHPAHQRSGLGTAMLHTLATMMDRSCYCLPYAHLEGFYGQIGFTRIEADTMPTALAERYAGYLMRGLNIVGMLRRGSNAI
ncbi:GNAT family N-acetyltransferase [Jeongeupia naejangsanensis]|uniref:GNAT family N-acetyltransferase n=1 Tax=Jeongeupia naejangsanensis TaxID=613195 RepID=A0ABS2BML9_9NEIS|nr:GNAT family N-acetyltransferase [Jeongeupia naejangsanensis]MBM3116882.1 GNAT family N-acetyltransferase [Jeongeupia naejangsanensis]